MHRKIILAGGLLVVCLLFAIFYLQAIYFSWQSEILQIQVETKKLKTTEKILQNFSERQKKFPALVELSEENLISAREFLPVDTEQEKFTDEIYRAANKNNIEINSIQVDEVSEIEKDKNFYRQSVKVQFAADYISMLNFLREISDGKRFSTLANISIDSEGEKLFCTAEFFIYSATLK